MRFLRVFKSLTIVPLISGCVVVTVIAAIVVSWADTSQDKPDPNVKVTSISPTELVTNPSNITITFSRDLVPDESLEVLVPDPPLKFHPRVSGMARWVARNTLRFFPDSAFLPSTEYSVHVTSEKTYLYGNRINDDRAFHFRTQPVSVKNISTEIINIPEPPFESKLLIHIAFNYLVDPDELVGKFSTTIKKDGRPLKFSCDRRSPSADFTFSSEPFDARRIHGRFSARVGRGLNCIGGNMSLPLDFVRELSIPKPAPLVVNYLRSSGAGKNCVVEISLSQSTALSEIKEYISITPAVDYTVDQHYNTITLRGEFQPRQIYTVNIKKGLHSLNGQILEQDFSSKIKIEDLPPSLRFIDEGYYMPLKSRRLLEVETVNTNEITVEVEQIFANNMVYYLSGSYGYYYGSDIERVGRRIFYRDFQLPESLNEPLNSSVDLGSIVGDTLRGIYNVKVHAKGRRWNSVSRQVMITDLGILARKSDNYLMVWVNSLSDTAPVRDAEIMLMSRNNQVLARGKTDADGVAVFDDLSLNDQQSEPFLITVSKSGDLSYLRFSDCLISTAEFDVSGRPFLSKGYESFIYSERGVYRPGETLHLVVTTRGKGGLVPPEFPYMLKILDPRGNDFVEFKIDTKDRGISSIDYDIPSFAETGAYSVLALIDKNVLGRYSFQVEEFMPDRIKTSLSLDKSVYSARDTAVIGVNGKYLFGPPCSENEVGGHVTIENDIFKPKEWSAFNFVNFGVSFSSVETDLPDQRLDAEGNYTYIYPIPGGLKPPSSLKMLVSATVKEDGGRAVSDYKAASLSPYNIYLGIKTDFDRFVRAGEPAKFSVVAVNYAGEAVPVDSLWARLYRTIYHTIIRKDSYGNYRYVSEPQDQLLDSSMVAVKAGPAEVEFVLQEYGAYKVLVQCSNTAHTATQSFYVSGWGYSPWSMTNPDRIELELDKNRYNGGDKAKLLVKAPFEGRLLLTVENDKVLSHRTYSLDSNTAEIILPVSSEYAPNVYVSATLIKSTTSLERLSPSRAFGIIPLMIDNSNRKLNLALDFPLVMKPRQKVTVKLSSNAAPGAKYTIALVDVGILQLTDFTVPDPFEFFHGRKSPVLKPYDIYSTIFPDVDAAGNILSPAGGAYKSERKRHLNPISARRVKPVALWSGLLETDENGAGSIEFDIPQFNGKLTVEAVLIDGARCGALSKEMTVRDKIVIQECLPRFLAPGDKLDANVVAFNNTGKSEILNLKMIVRDPSEAETALSKDVFVENGRRASSSFEYEAPAEPGKLLFDITATDGVNSSNEKVEMPNRPAQPLRTEHGSGVLQDGMPATITMPEDWLEGTARYGLKISSLPAVTFTNSIQYLLRYPYGCIEQTTSKIIPILYFNDLVKVVEPELFGTKGHEYFVQEGIAKISSMQEPSGAFKFWPGGREAAYPWASVYASHALVEARKAGFWISDDVYDKMIGFLKRSVRQNFVEVGREPLRIYASYVLALAGELDKSVINTLKKLDVYGMPAYSRFQLAGAIAMTSGVDDALWLMPVEIHPENYEPESGRYFDSDMRANAIMIETLCEINPDHPSLPALVRDLSEKMRLGRWYTTQGQAFALMAMGKYFKEQEKPDYNGAVVIGGKRFAQFGTTDTSFVIPAGMTDNIEISIAGAGKCYYYWQASGVSMDRTIKEFDNRITVRRQYLDTDGQPLNMSLVEPGDQVVVKISAISPNKTVENVVINDLLPACAEIENPRLKTSAKLHWIPDVNYEVDYMDIRDDRLLLFLTLRQSREFDYFYTLRIIASGEFTVPPIAAECMYDPTIASAASSGSLSVIKSNGK